MYVGEIEYPSTETGNIAPGMSMLNKIAFLPPSF